MRRRRPESRQLTLEGVDDRPRRPAHFVVPLVRPFDLDDRVEVLPRQLLQARPPRLFEAVQMPVEVARRRRFVDDRLFHLRVRALHRHDDQGERDSIEDADELMHQPGRTLVLETN